MHRLVKEVLHSRGIKLIDADGSVGGKDFLARILELIRSTGFTIAIFSDHTRPTALANIMLELGFAAMCGKPILIVKSARAQAPSDFSRTDWIVYDESDEPRFRNKIRQGLVDIDRLVDYERTLLRVALDAPSMDCAVAFERAVKGFLLSGRPNFVTAAKAINKRLAYAQADSIQDIDRLKNEVETFLHQARSATPPKRQGSRRKRTGGKAG